MGCFESPAGFYVMSGNGSPGFDPAEIGLRRFSDDPRESGRSV